MRLSQATHGYRSVGHFVKARYYRLLVALSTENRACKVKTMVHSLYILVEAATPRKREQVELPVKNPDHGLPKRSGLG